MASSKLSFRRQALLDLDQLSSEMTERIVTKLEWYCQQKYPLAYAKRLKDFAGLYRFRIGDYRVLFDYHGNVIDVHRIGHRRLIYL